MSTSQLIASQAAALLTHPPSTSLPPPFHVRLFQSSDLHSCRSLLITTTREFLTDDPPTSDDPYLSQVLSSDMNDITAHYLTPLHSTYVVACDMTGVIGMVGLRPMSVAHPSYYAECREVPTPYSLPFKDASEVLELNRMAVLPSARRRGVARALNGECVRFCKECGMTGIHLQTSIGIGSARALYTSLGYIEYRVDRYDRAVLEGKKRKAGELSEGEEPKMNIQAEDIPPMEVMTQQRQKGVWYVAHFFLAV